jgi:purine-nucleoside phosphorylase
MADQIAEMREAVSRAVDSIRQHTQLVPAVGLVLGSGLGGLASELEDAIAIPYEAIPGWPRSTVHGHSGRLVIGHLEGRAVVCQQGRAHFYEGYTLQQVTFPVRVMGALGISILFLTNAAGGLDRAYRTGDLMLLNDHINFVGMSGNNPLMGPNDDTVGPRFLGMSQTYDRRLRDIARSTAEESHIPLHTGCYACLSGPFFETPAEVRFLRGIGANAVGMSTVHEVLVARHMGLRVIAVSGITNEAIDEVDSSRDTNHEEVLEAGLVIVPRLRALVRGVLKKLE